ncbi:hypothetical protein TNCV_1588331 [Trichonephila clavipes]|uniref:Uncharacterized protein n=1 Tax=Trichonephila clavipes TaxID=2585209 RepID=A0A8X6REB4_TRICX|nr:hypothetical protein TNCV_1588331 [Trichonephila clavipes]
MEVVLTMASLPSDPLTLMVGAKSIHYTITNPSEDRCIMEASSDGRITSTHMTRGSPICPTSLFQTLAVARNELESCGEAFFQLSKDILNLSATEIFTIRLRIASYRHQLSAQFRCAVAPAIHSLDTKF